MRRWKVAERYYELALSRWEDKKQSGWGLEKEETAKSRMEIGATMRDQGRHHWKMHCRQESDGPYVEYSPGGLL
jgi:hypothetical protein